MEKSFIRRFSILRSEVIDNIRSLVGDEKIVFEDKPVFTEIETEEGVCGTVEVDYIYKKVDDIFVVGINIQTDDKVEYNITHIEQLDEIILINDEIENLLK